MYMLFLLEIAARKLVVSLPSTEKAPYSTKAEPVVYCCSWRGGEEEGGREGGRGGPRSVKAPDCSAALSNFQSYLWPFAKVQLHKRLQVVRQIFPI